MSVPLIVCSLVTHLNMPMTVCSALTVCKEWEGENMHKHEASHVKGKTGPCSNQVCALEPHRSASASTALVRQNHGSWCKPAANPMRSHPLYLRKPHGDPHTAVAQLFSGPGVTGLGLGCIHRAPSFWNTAAPAELRLYQAK